MKQKPYPSETQERFIVRFPDGMRDRIAEAAKANNRSMNAEIVSRLAASFPSQPDNTISASNPQELVEKLKDVGDAEVLVHIFEALAAAMKK